MTRETYSHDTYLSPFTWRYGSDAMRAHWGETHKRRLWRRLWVALAQAQQRAGLVSQDQVDDLAAHVDDVDIAQAHAIEAEIKHDLMAEVRVFASQCPVGGGIIHLGATSMDIEDNADALRVRDATTLLINSLAEVLRLMAQQIETHADLATMAFTHLQPAEPTTVGYRLAQHAQDLLEDWHALRQLRSNIRGKGFKGACGTSASYQELLEGSPLEPIDLESAILAPFDLRAWPVATQTYPRKQDFVVLSTLAGLAQSLSRFAFDLRVLQSPPLGEWSEPFGKNQVGSSAMPFKRNPINAENMSSMARTLAAFPRIAWDNAAQGVLERTLDDSANRRTTLPEAFLMADEMLRRATRILRGLRVDAHAAQRLLDTYGVFAATERLLMVAVREGGDRQVLHEVIREHSIAAWEAMRSGQPNPLEETLSADPRITALIASDDARALLDARGHLGDAPQRARMLAQTLRAAVPQNRGQ